MTARERISVLVRMPDVLQRALVTEVRRRDSNINDVLVGVLAERVGASFSPSGRRSAPRSTSGAVLLRLPPALKRLVDEEALERGSSVNELIVETSTSRARAADGRLCSKEGDPDRRCKTDSRSERTGAEMATQASATRCASR